MGDLAVSDALSGRRAVVIGAGIAGLGAAIALARHGASVTVLERDSEIHEGPASQAFATWQRSGAPQVRHSHVFLGRLRNLLRAENPKLLEELMAAGARELRGLERPPLALRGITPEAGDEDLVTLAVRRTTFEVVLRRHALAYPNVRLVTGAQVTGLTAARFRTPIVSGVTYRCEGEERLLAAHFVVDASGRRSQAPEWLRSLGCRTPVEETEPSGILYYTRFYRMLDGAEEPPQTEHPTAGDYDWIKYAVFPADDRTFSITLAVPQSNQRLKILANEDAFDELMRQIPALAPWTAPHVAAPAEGASRGVQAMSGLINRVRRFVDERGPLAERFFVLGDGAYCTNPLYGRGCTQALLYADALARELIASQGDYRQAAIALDRWAHGLLEPFYRASITADRDAVRRAEGRASRRAGSRLRDRFFREGVAVAMRFDPVVFRAFLRMLNMIETPDEAFARPEVLARCFWVMLRSKEFQKLYPVPPLPDRELMLKRCEAAAGARRASRKIAASA